MAIKTLTGPLEGRAVLSRALADRRLPGTSRNEFGDGRLAMVEAPLGGSGSIASPVRMQLLQLKDISGNSTLERTVTTGWRYPVVQGQQVGLATLRETADHRPEFAGISLGFLSERFAKSSFFAEAMLKSIEAELEPRILEVPALKLVTLWFHGIDADYFIPLIDGVPVQNSRLLSKKQMVAKLLREAKKARQNAALIGGGESGGAPSPSN